jgi:protein TonB
VKRFLFPLGLTLAIHGLFLGAGGDWLKKRISYRPRPVPIALTLSYQQPKRPALSPSPPQKRPDDIRKKHKPITKEPKRKQVKSKPPKKIKKIVKPKTHKKLQKIEPITKQPKPVPFEPPPPSEPESFFGNQDQEVQQDIDLFPELLEEVHQKVHLDGKEALASVPPAQIIREAIPVYRENPPPQYPRVARRRGYQGTVVLEVLVNREGSVGDLRVFQSSGYSILDKAAIRSVKGWLFEPGRRGDEKIEMWVNLPIRFQIKE